LEEMPRELNEKTSPSAELMGLRCSIGIGGTGGVKAFISEDAWECCMADDG